jgi:2-polyprenyl-3-methyl-5-hydroxy-6-metoxy-1,4-benzoquinol methylase
MARLYIHYLNAASRGMHYMPYDEYCMANRIAWETWTDDHIRSNQYGLENLRKGDLSLTPVDLLEVGDVDGRSLLHLMCHIGTDTLSWARRGATVTGVDFSAKSIEAARSLCTELDLAALFVESEIYDANSAIKEQFDIVYTSGGVICWLPDVPRWAGVVSSFIKPGGLFYLREIHPIFWTLAQDRNDSLLVIEDDYFESGDPHRDDESVVGQSQVQTSYGWSHSLGEIVSSLIDAGLRIEFLHEHRVGADWSWLLDMNGRPDGQWELQEDRNRLPLEYSIRAIKD